MQIALTHWEGLMSWSCLVDSTVNLKSQEQHAMLYLLGYC